jgi:uncharacterized membrane protein HdeD (DUF308 family)
MAMFIGVPDPQAIRDRWKWFLGFGFVLAVLGVLALFNAVDATIITTIYVGFLLLIGGVVQVIGAFTGAGTTGGRILRIVLGVLYVVVGFDLVTDPISGTVTLTIAVAIMLIVIGAIRLWAAFTEPEHRLLLGAIGVLSILLGAWLWSGIPMSGVAIGIFVGLELLMAGISWIVVGWMARSIPDSASTAAA